MLSLMLAMSASAVLAAAAPLLRRGGDVSSGLWVLAAVSVVVAAAAWRWAFLAPWALGCSFGTAAVGWRDWGPTWEWPWLAAVGLGGGWVVYRGGWMAAVAAMAAAAAGATAVRWGESPAGAGRFGVKAYRRHLLVCVDKPCRERGALALRQALGRDRRFRLAQGIRVTPSGCLGCCHEGPIIWAEPEGNLYRHVEATSLERLLVAESDTSGGSP
jgi:(2Fe-2S) ferredoxin